MNVAPDAAPQAAQDLTGRHAVITGGANGLGRAIAERLSRSGARITIVDLADALVDVPEGWTALSCDLGAASAKDDLGAFAARQERIDIVVANAGLVPPWRGVADLDAQEWAQVMAVNTWGVAATLGAFADPLARSPHGAAVVMASINGYRAHGKQVLYTASKHAVIGIMRAAALDLGPHGVRVNALAPGTVATDALLHRMRTRHAQGGPSPEEALADTAEMAALKRVVTAAEVANAAHYLVSDASSGLTGVVLPMEAGLG
jgi:NAD(P)-dependent dehydrogenase (short-subunit alcohol dehydrogenase family)